MLNVTDFIIGLKIVKERYLLKADFEIHIFVLKLNSKKGGKKGLIIV